MTRSLIELGQEQTLHKNILPEVCILAYSVTRRNKKKANALPTSPLAPDTAYHVLKTTPAPDVTGLPTPIAARTPRS